jgi:hypothetical protein
MNYLYQAHYEVGFSRHARPDLNPVAAIERGAARRLHAQLLRDAPLELDVHGPDVDWNRDGLISDAAVRAPLTWGTFKSCNTSEVGLTVLADHDVAAVSPVLLSEANARHALWLDGEGRVWWRRGTGDGDSISWSEPHPAGTESGLRFIAGLALGDGRIALAVVRSDGAIALYERRVGGGGLQPSAAIELGASRTDRAPSLTRGTLAEAMYGATHGLRVVYRSSGLEGWLLQVAPPGPFAPRALLDSHGLPLTAANAPGLIDLPTGETCGVFTDRESNVRVFCYEPSSDRWADVSQRAFDVGLGPHTSGPVSLALSIGGMKPSCGRRSCDASRHNCPYRVCVRLTDRTRAVSKHCGVRIPVAAVVRTTFIMTHNSPGDCRLAAALRLESVADSVRDLPRRALQTNEANQSAPYTEIPTGSHQCDVPHVTSVLHRPPMQHAKFAGQKQVTSGSRGSTSSERSAKYCCTAALPTTPPGQNRKHGQQTSPSGTATQSLSILQVRS